MMHLLLQSNYFIYFGSLQNDVKERIGHLINNIVTGFRPMSTCFCFSFNTCKKTDDMLIP